MKRSCLLPGSIVRVLPGEVSALEYQLFSWQILKTEAGTKRNLNAFKFVRTIGKRDLLHMAIARPVGATHLKENWFLLFPIQQCQHAHCTC
jgi:hypothetical protein